MPQLQLVQIRYDSNGFFSKEEWTVHFLTGDCRKHIDFRRVTSMLHRDMWVSRSPHSDTATIFCIADMECRFVTELHLFPGNDHRNSLSLVTVNRNQAGAFDLNWTIVYDLDAVWFKHQTLMQNPPHCCFRHR